VAFPVVRAGDTRDAVGTARGLARGGDAVVPSPACASYDMFRDLEHRGRAFSRAVEGLR
jgi:UDP-N-acetylmuramoylalanine--D-glutamate ligase